MTDRAYQLDCGHRGTDWTGYPGDGPELGVIVRCGWCHRPRVVTWVAPATGRCTYPGCDADALDIGDGSIEWATTGGTPIDHEHRTADVALLDEVASELDDLLERHTFDFVVDESVPPGEVQFRAPDGSVTGRLIATSGGPTGVGHVWRVADLAPGVEWRARPAEQLDADALVAAVAADHDAEVDHVADTLPPLAGPLANLARRLARTPRLGLFAAHVPGIGRVVEAAAEAEYRQTVAAERKRRGID